MAWIKKSPDATRGHFLTIQVDLQVYKHYHKFFGEQIFDLVYSATSKLSYEEFVAVHRRTPKIFLCQKMWCKCTHFDDLKPLGTTAQKSQYKVPNNDIAVR